MDSKTLITEISRYFDIRELVSKAVYDKETTGAWRLFDPRLLETLLVLRRDILRVPLVCNNWRSGGELQQRGFRENTCQIVRDKTDFDVLYISAHVLGKAVDLSSPQMDANTMRKEIQKQADKLPYPVRVEGAKGASSWLHIDVATSHLQREKVLIFN